MKALESLTDSLLMWGYDFIEQDTVWYGRHFRRPHVKPDWVDEDTVEDILRLCKQFLEQGPSSHALAMRAYCLMTEIGDPLAAAEAAKQALEVRPNNLVATTVLAEALMYCGKPSEARSLARKAVHMDPEFDYPKKILHQLSRS
ncbi:tetratricopeptide repeat protein [Streptomyces sp. NPDC048558]|uniref:tetratricopeptide repeat protein n=1 Tax=Streptomyces sp. NPDC048558 TaxID=3155759 RepID=UPI00341813EE